MTDEPVFSRAELCAISNAPEDAVVFWDRQGLIVGVQPQPRAHKRYNRREVMVATLLNEFRCVGLNVAAMRSIVSELRLALSIYDAVPKVKHWLDVIDAPDAASFEEELAGFKQAWALSDAHLAELRKVRQAIPYGMDRVLWFAISFYDPRGEIVAWPDCDGEWHFETSAEHAFVRGARSAVIINWGRICNQKWPSNEWAA